MNIVQKVTLIAAGATFSVATGIPALAVGANSHANAHALTAGSGASHGSQAAAHMPSDPGSQGSTRLAAAKLKSCQNREKAIDNIMARISDRGQRQLTLFTTIATRVENFYTTKGNTLANYDSLVAAVNTQQAAAQTVVNQIKSDSVSFKCDGTDPKGAIQSFRTDLTSGISALKAYRASVKNLIVGVASVEGTTNSTNSTTNDTTNGGQ